MKYNPPPNWPKPPANWTPPPNWRPLPEWGPPPPGWQLWIEDSQTDATSGDVNVGSMSEQPASAGPQAGPSPFGGPARNSQPTRKVELTLARLIGGGVLALALAMVVGLALGWWLRSASSPQPEVALEEDVDSSLSEVTEPTVTASPTEAFKTLEFAVSICDLEDDPDITLGDDGRSLTIDTQGEDEVEGASIDDAACIFSFVGVPDSTVSKMDGTRALDGQQSDSWDDMEITWSYHPSSGIRFILTQDE